MGKEFDKLNKKLVKQFGKDRVMSLATSVKDVPTIRIIDAYYRKESFYIVTHESSEKVKQMIRNRNVSLCTGLHEFQGIATNIGHPLDKKNEEIRELLVEAFSKWYFAHNDESDPKMCFIKVDIISGFTHFNKIGYKVDFRTREVTSFPVMKNG